MRSSEDAPIRSSIPPCFTRRDSLLTALPASCRLRSFNYRWVPICATCLVAAFWFHSHAAKLGIQLADLHLDNKRLGETLQKEAGIVGMAVGPRGHPPQPDRGRHLASMGVWAELCCCCGGQTCVAATGKECKPKAAYLVCSKQ